MQNLFHYLSSHSGCAGSSVKEVYVTEGKVLFARKSGAEGVILTKDMQASLSPTRMSRS